MLSQATYAAGSLMALAQAAAPSAPSAGPLGAYGQLMPFVLIIGVFYFMMIRPQQKKARELSDWLKSLKKGDEVVTSGGLIGKITGLTDDTVILEVQEKVRLRVLRNHITGRPPGAAGSSAAPVAPAPEAPK